MSAYALKASISSTDGGGILNSFVLLVDNNCGFFCDDDDGLNASLPPLTNSKAAVDISDDVNLIFLSEDVLVCTLERRFRL